MIGSLGFTFSSFNLLHFIHPTIVLTTAHIPWLLWAIDGLLTSRGRWPPAVYAAVLALVTGSQILLGFPQVVWFSLISEGAYALFLELMGLGVTAGSVGNALRGVPQAGEERFSQFAERHGGRSLQAEAVSQPLPGRRFLRPAWLRLLGAKLLGLMLGAVQLLPMADMLAQSTRASATPQFFNLSSLDPRNLLQLVAPYLTTRRVFGTSTHEFGLYAGAVPLALACWALVDRRRWGGLRGLAWSAAGFGLAALLLSLGEYGPLYRLQRYLPLVGKFRCPCRYTLLFQLSIVRAGVDRGLALDRPLPTGREGSLAATVAAWDSDPGQPGGRRVGAGHAWNLAGRSDACRAGRTGPDRPGKPAGGGGGPRPAAGDLRTDPAGDRRPGLLRIEVCGLWTSPDLAAVSGQHPGAASGKGSELFLLRTGAETSVAFRSAKERRFRGAKGDNPTDIDSPVLSKSTIKSSDPFSLRVAVNLNRVKERGFWSGPYNRLTLLGWKLADGYLGLEPVRRLDLHQPAALRVACVRWVLRGPAADRIEGLAVRDSRWLEVPRPLPYVRLVTQSRQTGDPARDIGRIDVETTALAEAPLGLSGGPAGRILDVAQQPGRVEARLDCPTRQLLVVAESYHPGWLVRVDGRPQPVHRINGDFLGCLVGPGSRQVIFEFRPRSLSAGRAIAFCGLGLVILALAVPVIRGSRTRS